MFNVHVHPSGDLVGSRSHLVVVFVCLSTVCSFSLVRVVS